MVYTRTAIESFVLYIKNFIFKFYLDIFSKYMVNVIPTYVHLVRHRTQTHVLPYRNDLIIVPFAFSLHT